MGFCPLLYGNSYFSQLRFRSRFIHSVLNILQRVLVPENDVKSCSLLKWLYVEKQTVQTFDRLRPHCRGERENSSKPLEHSIVKCILVFKLYIQAYFCPLKILICSDFLAESLVIRKLQGSKLTFSNRCPLQGKNPLKMGNYTIF